MCPLAYRKVRETLIPTLRALSWTLLSCTVVNSASVLWICCHYRLTLSLSLCTDVSLSSGCLCFSRLRWEVKSVSVSCMDKPTTCHSIPTMCSHPTSQTSTFFYLLTSELKIIPGCLIIASYYSNKPLKSIYNVFAPVFWGFIFFF